MLALVEGLQIIFCPTPAVHYSPVCLHPNPIRKRDDTVELVFWFFNFFLALADLFVLSGQNIRTNLSTNMDKTAAD